MPGASIVVSFGELVGATAVAPTTVWKAMPNPVNKHQPNHLLIIN
jgi:hypothetical protein